MWQPPSTRFLRPTARKSARLRNPRTSGRRAAARPAHPAGPQNSIAARQRIHHPPLGLQRRLLKRPVKGPVGHPHPQIRVQHQQRLAYRLHDRCEIARLRQRRRLRACNSSCRDQLVVVPSASLAGSLAVSSSFRLVQFLVGRERPPRSQFRCSSPWMSVCLLSAERNRSLASASCPFNMRDLAVAVSPAGALRTPPRARPPPAPVRRAASTAASGWRPAAPLPLQTGGAPSRAYGTPSCRAASPLGARRISFSTSRNNPASGNPAFTRLKLIFPAGSGAPVGAGIAPDLDRSRSSSTPTPAGCTFDRSTRFDFFPHVPRWPTLRNRLPASPARLRCLAGSPRRRGNG